MLYGLEQLAQTLCKEAAGSTFTSLHELHKADGPGKANSRGFKGPLPKECIPAADWNLHPVNRTPVSVNFSIFFSILSINFGDNIPV